MEENAERGAAAVYTNKLNLPDEGEYSLKSFAPSASTASFKLEPLNVEHGPNPAASPEDSSG